MRLKIRNGIIYNLEDDRIMGTISDDSPEVERIIECGSEAVPAIEEFVENVKRGKFHPKKQVKAFEDLLNKYQ